MFNNFFKAKLTKKTIKVGKRHRGLLFFNPSPFRIKIFAIGTIFFVSSIVYLLFLYLPLTQAYINYKIGPKDSFVAPIPSALPLSKLNLNDFYIDIPKIKASSQVYPNISPKDEEVYLDALKKGVAHSSGSFFPGQGKTIYLFAHSTNTPINAVRYNAVFMLLGELKTNDPIYVYFSGKSYKYVVKDKKIVTENRTDFLSYSDGGETLILQTCWPPGTTWNRLLIFAKPE